MDYLFSGYYQFHAVLAAAAVFLFVKTIAGSWQLSDKAGNLLRMVSGASFGVFLLHRDILSFVQRHWDPTGLSWSFRLIGGLATYLGTMLLVLAMKKVPYIRRLVP